MKYLYKKFPIIIGCLFVFSAFKAQTVIHVNINQPAPLTLSTGDSAIYCTGGNPVQLNAVASGGTPSYLYTWMPSFGLDDSSIANPQASPSSTTSYTVIMVDGNGCSRASAFIVNVQTCLGIGNPDYNDAVQIFPNPGTGIFNISSYAENMNVQITDAIGNTIYLNEWKGSADNSTHAVDLSSHPSGIYFIKLRGEGFSINQKLIIQ